ncbi:hypothetical protein GPJ56_003848 [Histomonas meleagridis]|uniref:uncharacterized protein n=1 Tax=Histomonas meleagridis TaxID=135588 RepID=UPI00355A9A43|nr:hypothetical protein GPJ56_003848 [Histomonas meleagridis]KAH0805307.1 hypothetical protein GO595_002252 [Histomonas meleagridis]
MYDDKIDIEAELTNIFKTIIFLTPPSSDRVSSYLIKLAHQLPGSPNFEDFKDIILFFSQFLKQTKLWDTFVNHLYQATDYLAFTFTSQLLQRSDVKENPLIYLSASMNLIDNESKLWGILPKADGDKLRSILSAGLYSCITSEYLMQSSFHSIYFATFLDTFVNYQFLTDLIDNYIIGTTFLKELSELFLSYFISKSGTLKDTNNPNNLQSSLAMIEELITLYEKLDLLAQTKMYSIPGFSEKLENVRQTIIQNPDLSFEYNAARYISKCIETMCNDPSKKRDQLISISQCAKIVSFSNKKMEFIETHNTLMLVRLCQFAGQQYQVEETAIECLEPYMPPTLAKPFQNMLKDFETSAKINNDWEKKPFGYVLRVFVLPTSNAQGVASKFDQVILPKVFNDWKSAFTQFFLGQKNSRVKLKWIYEDNIVMMKLSAQNRYDFQIKMPLLLAIVIVHLSEVKTATYRQIAESLHMKVPEIEVLIKKGLTKAFMLFRIMPKDKKEDTIVMFNPAFKTPKKKFAIIIPAHFSLQLAQKSVQDQLLAKKRLKVYQSIITRTVKGSKKVSDLGLATQAEKMLSSMFPFDPDEFGMALNELLKQRIIMQNGKYYTMAEN